MATTLEKFEKEVWIEKNHANIFHNSKKIVKICPVDAEIYSVDLKKKKFRKVNI